MRPEEKAIELIEKYYLLFSIELENTIDYREAIQCVLITVDEIIKSDPISPNDVDWDDAGGTHLYYHLAQKEKALEFWKQVKQELKRILEKLL